MENRRCLVPRVGDLVGQLDLRCEWCSKVYKNLASYQNHIHHTHNFPVREHNFNCFHCPCPECRYHQHGPGVQVFRHIGQLRRHYQQKHMPRPFSCVACQRRFPLESELAAHRCCQAKDAESSAIVKSHVCTVCGKGYQRLNSLRRHILKKHGSLKERVHQKENPKEKRQEKASCVACQRRFPLESALASHRCCQAKDAESSTIVKRHVCTVCGKGYQRLSSLRRHFPRKHGALKEQVHQKENPKEKKQEKATTKEWRQCIRRQEHRCLQCDHVFISKETLELHVKSRHQQRMEDERFMLEMEQLVRGIEDGTVRDAPLLKELASILPELRRLQESDTKTT